MANPAVIGDVIARWRPLSTNETTVGTTLLGDAYGMLQRRFLAREADLDELLTADADGFVYAVKRVLANAVIRVLKNPDAKLEEQIDDYKYKRAEILRDGLLYFTDDELDELLPGSGVKGRAYSLDPFAGRDWDEIA